jgi:multidrug efflux system outer membrane protein
MLRQRPVGGTRARKAWRGAAGAQGIVMLLLTGCAVGPNFHPPKAAAPAGWASPMAPATAWVAAPSAAPATPTSMPATASAPATAPASQVSVAVPQIEPVVRWWTTFNDPALEKLVRQATDSNLDIRAALARILQARATRSIAVADLFPSISASAAYSRHQAGTALTGQSSSGSSSSGTAAATILSNLLQQASGAGTGTGTSTAAGTTAAPTGPLHAVPHSAWQAGFDATWELDAFGGIRRNIEAATANVEATIEDSRNVLISVLAEVALNYVELRGLQREIAIAQENLLAQEQTAAVTRRRFEGGFVSRLDVANANAQVATTKSGIPSLHTQARQAIYNLSVLLGREPGALVAELALAGPIPLTPPEVPIGLPSELLRRRPDVRQAEALLHAATAQVGVATAQLFPQFALAGSFGWQTSRLESLVNWDHNLWSFGPTMNLPIFEGGRLWANVQVQDAVQKQALLAYEKAVLTAFQDVENALVAYTHEQERRMALTEAVAANREAVDLSMRLYTQGQIEFLNVLVAQAALYASETALVQSELTVATDLIALYKALGGGWEIQRAPRSTNMPIEAVSAGGTVPVLLPSTQPAERHER